jgi:phosphonate transport system substrate-binding protein
LHFGIALPSPPLDAKRPAVALASARVKLDVFCQCLADVIDAEVAPRSFGDYDSLLAAMNLGSVDLGWLPPRIAARSAVASRTVPVAMPIRGDETCFWSGLFTVSPSVGTVEDLNGLRAAWVDPESMAGHRVVCASLRAKGVDLSRAFRRQAFLHSHPAVVCAVVGGKADVGATFVHLAADSKTIVRAGWGDANVHVVHLAGPIPGDVLAAGVDAAPAIVARVRAALTANVDDDLRAAALALFEADRFVQADAGWLEPLAALLRHTGR